jgi:hypothetical protein
LPDAARRRIDQRACNQTTNKTANKILGDFQALF